MVGDYVSTSVNQAGDATTGISLEQSAHGRLSVRRACERRTVRFLPDAIDLLVAARGTPHAQTRLGSIVARGIGSQQNATSRHLCDSPLQSDSAAPIRRIIPGVVLSREFDRGDAWNGLTPTSGLPSRVLSSTTWARAGDCFGDPPLVWITEAGRS